MRRSRTARSTPLAAAVCAVAAIWSAPSAAAEVIDVTIVPGLGGGPTTPYGAGCTYLVVARTAAPAEAGVSIVDYTGASTMFPQELIWDTVDPYYNSPVALGHAFTLWTPTEPGEHSLMAYQTSAGGPIETVTVNPGTPIGPGCIVAP
ncbi:hypothetical protein [Rhodococcus tibetensis]|uniref:Secreted protein n=1 Tax=Rhodococcus tibetensis TaxID=2965064 RepID=A0ABT1QGZ8_9NOCA|nr:hypothetical protein [Rhodococcus sp. FXJ9.536]MCQ4121559.1 hypothetical protein [Rhodococcus sp. FXJ9.536]